MATSEVQICSNALLLLGAETINSFDDASDRALLAGNLWVNCRDAVIRSHPWNCAVKRVALAPDVTAPAFDYTYQFSLPGDWIRTLSVGQEGDSPDFRMEGGKILCDDNPLYLRYLFRNTDVSKYDALLVEALTAYMAMTMAYPITKSAAQQDVMSKLFQYKLRQARTVDGQEEPPQEVGDFPFLNARR